MNRLRFTKAWALVLALVVAPSNASAAPFLAVWLDGDTTPGGGVNGIPESLTAAFGAGSFTLVTTAQLETPDFLNGFEAVIISRSGSKPSNIGGALSTGAVTNIQKYVGSGPNQGGVATFTNDAADSLCDPAQFTCTNTDPYDSNLNKLFINAVTLASATGHGYVGELNGAIMAFTSNTSGFLPAIGLLVGSSTGVKAVEHPSNQPPTGLLYEVGPIIGTGHPIDQGVTFPFTTSEVTPFLGFVTGFDKENVVDQYGDNGGFVVIGEENVSIAGAPALVANQAVIDGVLPPPSVPEAPSLVLLGLGLVGLVVWKRGGQNRWRDG